MYILHEKNAELKINWILWFLEKITLVFTVLFEKCFIIFLFFKNECLIFRQTSLNPSTRKNWPTPLRPEISISCVTTTTSTRNATASAERPTMQRWISVRPEHLEPEVRLGSVVLVVADRKRKIRARGETGHWRRTSGWRCVVARSKFVRMKSTSRISEKPKVKIDLKCG